MRPKDFAVVGFLLLAVAIAVALVFGTIFLVHTAPVPALF